MTETTPEAADFRTIPPKITAAAVGWQAWWEDHDLWDGFLLYADLDTAKKHAAVDYVGEEYGWVPGDDPADEAPEIALTWAFAHERWHLLDNGKSTPVQLYRTSTYVASAGPASATDRAAVPGCVCGEPTTAGTVHRTDGPCHVDDRADVLSPTERTMLNYALNQAQLRMWRTPGRFTDEEQAAVVSLRRLTDEEPSS